MTDLPALTAHVRRARPEDAPSLAVVHVQAWRETYPGLLSDELLANLSVPEHEAMWRDILASTDAPGAWLAHVGGDVVGFTLVRAPHDDDAPRPHELGMMYVLDAVKGAGVADILVTAALGDVPAYLWVARDNPRAQRFYARHGFVADGATKTIPHWDDIVDVRMVR